MNTMLQKICLYARELRLPTVANMDSIVRDAPSNQWALETFLAEVLSTEIEQRKDNQRGQKLSADRLRQILVGITYILFATLKQELIHRNRFKTQFRARVEVIDYMFCGSTQSDCTHTWITNSPMEFERIYIESLPAQVA